MTGADLSEAPQVAEGASGLRLARRLAVAFAVFGGLAVLTFGAAGWAFNGQLNARHRLVDRIDPANFQTQVLLGAYLDEETGVRGFVLTGQNQFLDPYTQGLADQTTAQHRLDQLLTHERDSAILLARANRAAAAWTDQFAQPAITATRAHQVSSFASPAAQAEGKQRFDAVRAAFAALADSLQQNRAASRQRLDRAATVLAVTLAGGALLLVAAALATWGALRAWVTRPLDHVGADVRLVADGDLDHRIEPQGPPDFAALALDVDAMRRRILDELRQVDEARAGLASANTDLSRSNLELEQFAYVASHDLQEPLRKVTSFCQLLQRRYEGELDDKADEYIAFAVDGASRMQVLINDLLAFSRVGRTTRGFVAIDLAVALGNAKNNLAAALADAGVVVTADPLPTVSGDASLLTALLQNLIGNSIKFRSESQPAVHIGCRRQDDHWLLDATDNGIGVEARFADRVFIIFQRLHARDAYAGTGIGLALCKKIVEFHGGQIWIDTDHHPGTRVCWTLPIKGAS